MTHTGTPGTGALGTMTTIIPGIGALITTGMTQATGTGTPGTVMSPAGGGGGATIIPARAGPHGSGRPGG